MMDKKNGSNVIDLDAKRAERTKAQAEVAKVGASRGLATVENLSKRRKVKSQSKAFELYTEASGLDENLETIDEAIKLYLQAMALDPMDADIIVNLGNCYYRNGNGASALVLYRRAIELKETCPTAHYNLGYVHFEKNDYENAIPYFVRALRIDPKFADAHYDLAMCYEATERKAMAKPHWETYVKLMKNASSEDKKHVDIAKTYLDVR